MIVHPELVSVEQSESSSTIAEKADQVLLSILSYNLNKNMGKCRLNRIGKINTLEPPLGTLCPSQTLPKLNPGQKAVSLLVKQMEIMVVELGVKCKSPYPKPISWSLNKSFHWQPTTCHIPIAGSEKVDFTWSSVWKALPYLKCNEFSNPSAKVI